MKKITLIILALLFSSCSALAQTTGCTTVSITSGSFCYDIIQKSWSLTTGDITIDPTGASLIGNSKVTNAKLANMATGTIKSNLSALGPPVDNTLTSLMDFGIGVTQNTIPIRGAATWGGVLVSGDATLVSTGVLTLSSVITAGGPTGSATVTPIITYDAKGRLTTVSSATITPAASSITGTLGADHGGTGIANNTSSTITISGAFGTTFTVTGTTSVTLPTSGTLAALGGTNSWSGVNTFSNTTNSTSGSTGAINTLGGVGVTKDIFAGANLHFGASPTIDTSSGNLIINAAASVIMGNSNANSFFLASGGGNVGMRGLAASNNLSDNGDAARTWGMERHSTANTAGNTLEVLAGGATSGATNKNGGNHIISPGVSTGSGTSDVVFNTYPGTAGATSDNTKTETLRLVGSTGNVKFTAAGNFSANGSVATVLGSIGPTGSHTTVQKWLTIIDNTGTTLYIPAF